VGGGWSHIYNLVEMSALMTSWNWNELWK